MWRLSKNLVFIAACVISFTLHSHQADVTTQVAPTEVSESFFFNLKGAEPNEVFELQTQLSASTNYAIHVANVPVNLGFIIVQVHGFLHEISLAYASNYTQNNFVIKGTNVGLVEAKAPAASFNLSNPNPVNVSVMINVVGYSKTTPTPGGCNMVFNVEIAPYLQLSYNNSLVEVTSQPAMSTTFKSNCDRNSLSYEIYHFYQIERDFSMESYFKNLKLMMTVDSIRAHGRQVHPPLLGTNQKKLYSAYPGTGSVYAVIVSETQMGVTKSAAYVPIQTYACNPLEGSCEVLNTTLSKTVAVTISSFGILLCLHGHVSSNWETFIISSLWSGVSVAYHSRDAVNVLKPLVTGLIFGLIWLMIWSCCCTTYLSRISTYATVGAVSTAFLLYLGLGDNPIMENDPNFWLVFFTVVLLIVVLLHPGHHSSSIVACSLVGAYLTIIPLDHYIGSNLKYAVVNVIRRAVVENFNLATIDPPFQFRDIMITLLFLILWTVGYFYQLRKFKQRLENQSNSLPHLFKYFEPSFNETSPVLDREEMPAHHGGWFDASLASPGNDIIFAPSPNPPHTLGQPHLQSLPHPHPDLGPSPTARRLIQAALAGGQSNIKYFRRSYTPLENAERTAAVNAAAHIQSDSDLDQFLASALAAHQGQVTQSLHNKGQSKDQIQYQGQQSSEVTYPQVSELNNGSGSDGAPPPYDSIG